MKLLLIAATVLSVVPLVLSLFMPDWYLGDQQNAVEDADAAAARRGHSRSRHTSVSRSRVRYSVEEDELEREREERERDREREPLVGEGAA